MPKFNDLMASDQFLQSLFVLFHIEPAAKTEFAYLLNQNLGEIHQQLEDIDQQQ